MFERQQQSFFSSIWCYRRSCLIPHYELSNFFLCQLPQFFLGAENVLNSLVHAGSALEPTLVRRYWMEPRTINTTKPTPTSPPTISTACHVPESLFSVRTSCKMQFRPLSASMRRGGQKQMGPTGDREQRYEHPWLSPQISLQPELSKGVMSLLPLFKLLVFYVKSHYDLPRRKSQGSRDTHYITFPPQGIFRHN